MSRSAAVLTLLALAILPRIAAAHPSSQALLRPRRRNTENTPEGAGPFLSEAETAATHWSHHVGRHWVENVGDTTVRILLVEVKVAADGTQVSP